LVVSSDKLEPEDYRLQAMFFVDDAQEVRFRFRTHLHRDEVFRDFDLVIFDCPPRPTTSTINALTCSDFVLIPTKLDLGSMNAVPRTIRWLNTLQGIWRGRLIGVVANHVRFHAGKLTSADLNSYNYLRQVVSSFTGDAGLLLQATILGHRSAVSEEKGMVASLKPDGLALYSAFVKELRQRMQL
jgi:cellulose biosynthesis protein BcsQ